MEEASYFSFALYSFFHPYFPIFLHSSICLQTFPSASHPLSLLYPSLFHSIPPSHPTRFTSSVMTCTTVHLGPSFQSVLGVLFERQ
jgi:hypothetical protein